VALAVTPLPTPHTPHTLHSDLVIGDLVIWCSGALIAAAPGADAGIAPQLSSIGETSYLMRQWEACVRDAMAAQQSEWKGLLLLHRTSGLVVVVIVVVVVVVVVHLVRSCGSDRVTVDVNVPANLTGIVTAPGILCVKPNARRSARLSRSSPRIIVELMISDPPQGQEAYISVAGHQRGGGSVSSFSSYIGNPGPTRVHMIHDPKPMTP
jgi:hypothetical protein